MTKPYTMRKCFIALLLLAACTYDPATPSDDPIKQYYLDFVLPDNGAFSAHYLSDVISMPEYQPTLKGEEGVVAYWSDFVQKNAIDSVTYNISERFTFGERTLYLVDFVDYSAHRAAKGHQWILLHQGRIEAEARAYDFPVEESKEWVLVANEDCWHDEQSPNSEVEELVRLNETMEELIRERSGAGRADFFTHDGCFKAFEQGEICGRDTLLPYFIAYNAAPISIDSIDIHSTKVIPWEKAYLEMVNFAVNWSYNDEHGTTRGKGMRLWKRLGNGELKIYREIGLHDAESE